MTLTREVVRVVRGGSIIAIKRKMQYSEYFPWVILALADFWLEQHDAARGNLYIDLASDEAIAIIAKNTNTALVKEEVMPYEPERDERSGLHVTGAPSAPPPSDEELA